MTTKTRKSKKQLLADARRFLKKGFVTGTWVEFPDIGEWGPSCSFDDLKDLIERAKKTQANPDCYVCAEGAVYLACAMAGESIETAQELILKLDRATPSMRGGIMNFNDNRGDWAEVDHVFAEVEAAIDG